MSFEASQRGIHDVIGVLPNTNEMQEYHFLIVTMAVGSISQLIYFNSCGQQHFLLKVEDCWRLEGYFSTGLFCRDRKIHFSPL